MLHSPSLFELLIVQSQHAILILDNDNELVEINEKALEVLSLSRKEVEDSGTLFAEDSAQASRLFIFCKDLSRRQGRILHTIVPDKNDIPHAMAGSTCKIGQDIYYLIQVHGDQMLQALSDDYLSYKTHGLTDAVYMWGYGVEGEIMDVHKHLGELSVNPSEGNVQILGKVESALTRAEKMSNGLLNAHQVVLQPLKNEVVLMDEIIQNALEVNGLEILAPLPLWPRVFADSRTLKILFTELFQYFRTRTTVTNRLTLLTSFEKGICDLEIMLEHPAVEPRPYADPFSLFPLSDLGSNELRQLPICRVIAELHGGAISRTFADESLLKVRLTFLQ